MKTLNEKKSQHRQAHPRDKISFGEQPVPKPVKVWKIRDASWWHWTCPRSRRRHHLLSKKVDVVKAKPRRTRNTIPADLMKCRKCGAVTTPHQYGSAIVTIPTGQGGRTNIQWSEWEGRLYGIWNKWNNEERTTRMEKRRQNEKRPLAGCIQTRWMLMVSLRLEMVFTTVIL